VSGLKKIYRSFVDGKELVSTSQDKLYANFHPASNEMINEVAYASDETLAAAITSSKSAFNIGHNGP